MPNIVNAKSWSGATRNWKLKDEVWFNPERAAPEISKLAA
jgi:hypothetical protein